MSSPHGIASAAVRRVAFRLVLAGAAVFAVGCSGAQAPKAQAPASPTTRALSDQTLPHASNYPSARVLARPSMGRHWSNVALPLDGAWALVLEKRSREAWEAYVAIPAAQRDLAAFERTLVRTETLCKTPLQCIAEARVRTSFALQGFHDGASLLEWQGELWAAIPERGNACDARVARIRSDRAIEPVIAGVFCGPDAHELGTLDASTAASTAKWQRLASDR